MTEERKLLIDDIKSLCGSVSGTCYLGSQREEALANTIRDRITALLSAPAPEPVGWVDGEPPHPWNKEWFIAETIYGDRVCLTALPKEYTYDYKTADETYMRARNIKRWMQFPDSNYIPHQSPPASSWVRCADRFPTEKDADERGNVLVWHQSFGRTSKVKHLETVGGYLHPYAKSMADAVWQPLPPLPEDKQ